MDTPAAVPRPLRRDAELNRLRIMAAAREVFAERGLEATLDDVARQAGLGVGTVYRRFPNKEALVDALFEEGFGRVVAAAERSLENPDAWAGMVNLVTELAEIQAADRGLRDIMLSEAYGRDRVAQLRDRIKPMLEQAVERAQRQGGLRADFRAADVPALLMMIAMTVEFGRDVRPEVWRRYLTMLLDGISARRDHPTRLPEPELDDDDMHEAMHAWPRLRWTTPTSTPEKRGPKVLSSEV
ncbi:MAG TPA: helix-turn-helix domain-containing protein [Actinocrinis sp.]|uniref:TetR/AcrR family transcriptional regulator n=1 Tax=Actinocrinis sp. TaxID=1920516 RepID=UPI002DDC9030|nr:helix-turn-helix domain-containing protein [Actinocrinis sp.]HEV2347370.1 helix-turn-helix domain-containing protein [Actinocrinis sp.]